MYLPKKRKKKNDSSKKRNLGFYLSIIQFILSIILIITLIRIEILSSKFLVPIIIGVALVDLFVWFFLNNKRLKKKPKKIFCALSIIFSIICLIVTIVLSQVYSSMNDLFKNNSYIDYSVLTLKSANYKEIKDVDEKIIGFYVDDKYTDTAQKALDKSISAEYVGYSSINELKNALISNEIDAMLIMSSYLEALDNSNDEGELENISDDVDNVSAKEQELLNNIENFDNESKVLYTFKVKIDNSKKTKKIDLEKGSFAIYISGQDSYASSVSETSRSDVNLLMVVNLKTKQILLVSIPRDYYIKISSKGAYDKLTHISLFGSEEASKSLGDVLDVSIDYYVKFNFTTFMEAVEYLLPLDVYSDYDFTTSVYDQTIGNSYTFSKGYNHITDGKMALQFVRARKNFAEGDRQRGINQSRFLRAVIKKASSPSILLKYNKILKALEGTFLTNISDDSIREIAKYVIDNNGEFKINSMSLGGSDASRATYSGGSRPLYVMIPDNSSIEDAKVQIKTVLDGGVPDIQEDASELADVSKTHTVTSKDIGKSYGYSNGYSGSSSKNNVIVDNKENEEEKKKDDNDDDDNSGDKEDDKDDDPSPPPTTDPETPAPENPDNPNPPENPDLNDKEDNSENNN